jgi:hypothetical protein
MASATSMSNCSHNPFPFAASRSLSRVFSSSSAATSLIVFLRISSIPVFIHS